MSRLWKSQELFGPPFGPMRSDEPVRLSVALDASAEHKLPDMTCADLPSHRFPVQVANKPSTNMVVSSSPFSGSLPVLTDELLALYQDACIHGQAIPAFSPFVGTSSGTQSPSLGSSPLVQSSSTRDDAPVFSFTDLSDLTNQRGPSPKPSPTLRASTGTLPSTSPKTHRRTRSHFYALGEAPVVASGNELEDDDESSDEENIAPLLDHTTPTNVWGKGFYSSVSSVPIVKSIPMPLPARPVPKMRSVEPGLLDLPDSPPARHPSAMRASSANLDAPAIGVHHNSPKETPANQPIFDTSAPDLFGRPSSLPSVPEATPQLQALTIPPSPTHSQDDVEHQRDAEWKTLELSQAARFSLDSQEALSATACQNPHKNRYAQILALDATRVKLTTSGEGASDYINASYVRGAGEGVYISAQAPIPSTYGDFWRMVWEQKVHVIVMLTRLIEGGCPKAHKYWPTSKTRVYDDKYKITLVNRVESADYDYRVKEFEMESEGERRRLFQFQFTGWPDHGVPSSPESLLRMISSVNEQLEDIRACPFAEGPSPRVFEPPHTPDGRSSLNSSTSNSVKSASERHSLDEAEHPWSFGSASTANSNANTFNFNAGSGSSLHLPSAARNTSVVPNAGDTAIAGPHIRRCSSSQLGQASRSLRTMASHEALLTLANTSKNTIASSSANIDPIISSQAEKTTSLGQSAFSSQTTTSNASQIAIPSPSSPAHTHQRHESTSGLPSTRETDSVTSAASRSASQLTTRFPFHPQSLGGNPKQQQPPNLIHNGSNASLSSIASVSSGSSGSSFSSFPTNTSASVAPGALPFSTLVLDSAMMAGQNEKCEKSDGSISPTSNASLLSSYSSSCSATTASSAHSNQSSASFGTLPSMTSGAIPTASHVSPSYLGVPATHGNVLGASYHQSPPFALGTGMIPFSASATGLPLNASPVTSPLASSTASGVVVARPTPCAAKEGYEMGPVVVHCSAGIGRSGAFILIHSVLEKLKLDGKMQNDISLSELLEEMRKCRVGLVPHQMQYNFCYNAIDYCLCYKNLQRSFGINESSRTRTRQNAMQKSPLNRSSHVIPNFGSESAFF